MEPGRRAAVALNASTGQKKKGVTIERVAAQAGVSKTTVSFVLNGNPSISAATRDRVFRVIEELGYHPNINARNLSSRSNHTICVVIPEFGNIFEDPYFARAMGGACDEIAGADYRMMLIKASYEFALNKEYLNLFHRKEVSGMIYIGSTLDDGYLKDFAGESFPFVLVNSYLPNVPLPHVMTDNVRMGEMATEHLIQLGHHRIAHIAGSLNTVSALDRQAGYRKAMEAAALDVDEDLIVSGHFTREGAAEATRLLMSHKIPPTAIYVANDLMALGARAALVEAGIRVPREVALVGGDNIDLAQHMSPPLTTVDQRVYEVARESVRLLLDLIEGRPTQIQKSLAPRLIVRKSCGAGTPHLPVAVRVQEWRKRNVV